MPAPQWVVPRDGQGWWQTLRQLFEQRYEGSEARRGLAKMHDGHCFVLECTSVGSVIFSQVSAKWLEHLLRRCKDGDQQLVALLELHEAVPESFRYERTRLFTRPGGLDFAASATESQVQSLIREAIAQRLSEDHEQNFHTLMRVRDGLSSGNSLPRQRRILEVFRQWAADSRMPVPQSCPQVQQQCRQLLVHEPTGTRFAQLPPEMCQYIHSFAFDGGF